MRKGLALLVVCGVLLVACGPAAPTAGPKEGGTLRIAIGIDPDQVDPAALTTTTVQQFVDMVVERLVTIDQEGKIQPLLAESWDVAPDGLAYTFALRKGIKFHDGAPFNAQAVKFSIDRLLDKKTFKSQPGILTVIASTTVIDDTHVKFTLKNRLAPFVAAMTQTQAAIISPASVSASGNTPEKIEVLVGTGPYKWKDRVKGDHLTFVRNDDYWGKKPSYQGQEIKIVPEAASREALVRAGQADVIYQPPASDLPALRNDSSVKVIDAPSDRTIFIAINTVDTQQPLLQDRRVRQALNYAVDKPTMIKNVLFGGGTQMDAPMAKSLFGYCQVGDYTYNPQKAKSLLQEAGATGMTVKFVAPTGRYLQDRETASAVAGYLRDAGLKVEGPTTMDWPNYLATINVPPDKAKTDLHLLGWAPPYLDAQQQMEQFLSARHPAAGLATSYYKNAKVDDLINKANAATDQNARAQDYCTASKQIWEDAPWIFLWTQSFIIVHSSKVTGVGFFPNEKFYTVYSSPA